MRQYVDYRPMHVTRDSVQAWTDVAINADLGGIGMLTTDYAGNVIDPLQPPMRVGVPQRRAAGTA